MKTRSQTFGTSTKAVVSELIAKYKEKEQENIKLVFDISYEEIPQQSYIYPTVFDFDDSSREWNRNKQSLEKGTYVYKDETETKPNTSRYNLRPSRYRPPNLNP